ncbi:MAG: ribose-5-phosphate isomerase RpiA [Planctomycetota bacterium]|nr:ribose-5-phosphate isomerase RpiA [Planctomycetota bacterium]MDP6837452.1 ribose-5-phosphate isomerase RpiA [Planctomycetota bacterium]
MQDPKRSAGRRAAEMVENGMTVGLGTGSTVWFTLERLGERIAEEGLELRGVPTSRDTEGKARELGLDLVGLGDVSEIDLTIDGADEIDGAFRMIKGGGGALLREKVVAAMSRREVIVVGANKVVERLGTTFMLPVEVVPFARPAVLRSLVDLGCEPIVRQAGPEAAFRTDNGNEIVDCRFPEGIAEPEALEAALAAIPGVVESGLFIGLAHAVVIGTEDGGCEVRERDS